MIDDDPVGRLRAQADQAREAARGVAQNTAAFYKELLNEGVPDEDALAPTTEFLSAMLSGGDDE